MSKYGFILVDHDDHQKSPVFPSRIAARIALESAILKTNPEGPVRHNLKRSFERSVEEYGAGILKRFVKRVRLRTPARAARRQDRRTAQCYGLNLKAFLRCEVAA